LALFDLKWRRYGMSAQITIATPTGDFRAYVACPTVKASDVMVAVDE
jgi:hypothetical protein